jgi:predicted dehydrogenase
MDKIGIGVIGLGIMGRQYLTVYQRHPLTEVRAVANRSAERLEQVGAEFGFSEKDRYQDYRQLLERSDIDAVCIATPDFAHTDMVLDALDAGKHVLVEKPMTTSTAEADRIVAKVEETGRKVQVAYNHRWLPVYYQAYALIQKGEIGEPVMGFARKNDTIYVSTEMINWADKTSPTFFLNSHDVDLMRWYFGSEAVEARGYGRKGVLTARGIDAYDVVQGQVKFANGAFATFESGWIYPNTFPTIVDSFVEVIGTRGHLHLPRKAESMEMSTEQAFTYPRTFLFNDIFGKLGGAFPACLDHFVDCILNDREPVTNAREGRQVTAILEAIMTSVERGGETVRVG